MTIQHHTFWVPDGCRTFTALGNYAQAVAALEAMHPGQDWRHTAVRDASVKDLRPGAVTTIAVDGLKNDSQYWDIRRTYGDASVNVLRYLSGCAAWQARQESKPSR